MGRWIAYAVVLLLLAVALVLGTQGGKHRRLAETPRVQAVPAPQEPPAAVPDAVAPIVPVASAPVSPVLADVPLPPATMAPVVMSPLITSGAPTATTVAYNRFWIDMPQLTSP